MSESVLSRTAGILLAQGGVPVGAGWAEEGLGL